ncbi:rhomboid family intramembrane serine protease [Candidatus Woesearchaeota archaeon]|nr:rhomboid family intramembrane serine protease [Candidatus Woesearchaeota archaeon]MCF7900731.1 rhomboid family intramembrane serine protease [Candidatus Woesearchaeota archaeon]MCF8013252.1 rhomboid family intramembrane serine protease [Candidatus Woesearchaeota archaeon]
MKIRNASIVLILVNVFFFAVQTIIPGFTQAFVLNSSTVWFQPWTILTSMFMHGGMGHLIFNMYALFIFGNLIESKIGTKRFLFIYFISGIIAALAHILFSGSSALGASGAIMGILGVTIILLPNLRVLFFFVFPMSMRTAGIIFALIDIMGLITPLGSGIAHWAHLGGLAAGLLFGFYLSKKKKSFQKTFYSGPKVELQTKKKKNKDPKDIALDDSEINEYIKYGRL